MPIIVKVENLTNWTWTDLFCFKVDVFIFLYVLADEEGSDIAPGLAIMKILESMPIITKTALYEKQTQLRKRVQDHSNFKECFQKTETYFYMKNWIKIILPHPFYPNTQESATSPTHSNTDLQTPCKTWNERDNVHFNSWVEPRWCPGNSWFVARSSIQRRAWNDWKRYGKNWNKRHGLLYKTSFVQTNPSKQAASSSLWQQVPTRSTFVNVRKTSWTRFIANRLHELGIISSFSTGFKKISDLRNKIFANSRGDFFSGSLKEAIDGAADHYQVVHGENLGKTPVVNHMSDNINSCGEGSHKKFNGTISCVVMDIKLKDTVNLNLITSTKKETAPFPPLVLAALDSKPTYNNTIYESEFELLPSSFRPDFMIDLLMSSNVPLEQRPRQVPRPGVNQKLSRLETVITPKCLIGLRLIEATPIQTNRLYDTHDQQTSDDYLNRLRDFSRLSVDLYHPLCLTGDQGYLQRMVRSSSRHSDHQEYFVIKLGGFHIVQNAHACINRIYPSILYIPKILGQSHVADGKNHNSCRAYSETLTILLCKHPDRELLLKNPMLRDLFRWGLLFIAIRLSSCRVKQEYQEHFSILDSIDYLYG